MNDESDSQRDGEGEEMRAALHVSLDAQRRRWPPAWSEITREGRRTITKVFSYVDPAPDCVWVIEHDPDRGISQLVGPDGKTSTFRDKPARQLVLEPDLKTGELAPSIIQGNTGGPRYLYLCPEETQ